MVSKYIASMLSRRLASAYPPANSLPLKDSLPLENSLASDHPVPDRMALPEGFIPYGRRTVFSRWRQRYWTQRYVHSVSWLAVAILIGFLILGPQLILSLASLLPLDQLGNSGASIRAHTTIVVIAIALAIPPLVLIAMRLRLPCALAVDKQGISKRWFGGISGAALPWKDVQIVKAVLPEGQKDFCSYQLLLGSESTPGRMVLRLDSMEDDDQRTAVLNAIETFAPSAKIESSAMDLLRPKQSLSFTEVWLDALTAPPGRERLIALTDGLILDNRYRVERRLGAGGQGTAYLAEDMQQKKQVVLKETILPVYADLPSRKKALADFHKEAFALESVKHPGIVQYLGSFVADHRAYLVLEYVSGVTLSELVKKSGPVSPDRAITLAMQMCDILATLHAVPLIHRDFTPDNMIVRDGDNLVLIDFAVAVSAAEDSDEVAGKIAYMSPEQLKGKAGVQADIYSLGGTLYYALTGLQPDPLTECWPILQRPEISPELNELVIRATKYDNDVRFADAASLKAVLVSVPEAQST